MKVKMVGWVSYIIGSSEELSGVPIQFSEDTLYMSSTLSNQGHATYSVACIEGGALSHTDSQLLYTGVEWSLNPSLLEPHTSSVIVEGLINAWLASKWLTLITLNKRIHSSKMSKLMWKK